MSNFYKCYITNNIAKILQNVFQSTIYFNNGPKTKCVTLTYLGKILNWKVGDVAPPEKSAGA